MPLPFSAPVGRILLRGVGGRRSRRLAVARTACWDRAVRDGLLRVGRRVAREYLLAHDADLGRRLDAEADAALTGSEHHDPDASIDEDRVAGPAAQDQHIASF